MRAIKDCIYILGSRVVETDYGSVEYARIGKVYPALHENAHTSVQGIPNSYLLALPIGCHLFLSHNEEVKSEIARFL